MAVYPAEQPALRVIAPLVSHDRGNRLANGTIGDLPGWMECMLEFPFAVSKDRFPWLLFLVEIISFFLSLLFFSERPSLSSRVLRGVMISYIL